jgi:threonine dehydratase
MNAGQKRTAEGAPLSLEDYARRILSARVYDVACETPLERMARLGERCGNAVFLKREDVQPVHSFKLRGAYNKIAGLGQDSLARGVICASAGNHAQGVALAARGRGCRATVVMPRTTPAIKVQAVKALGGRVVLHGDSFDEAHARAREIEAADGQVFIHPYDDPDVIAGQGTVAMEILRQHPDPIDAIFVQIGGGGLAAGIAAYVKFLRPEIRVIGVEPRDAASMAAALAAGERVALDQVGLFADGVAVRQAGVETFRLCRDLLDDMVTVDTDEICAAIRDIFEDTRAVAEPAGAVGLAGLKQHAARHGLGGRRLIAINSGANLNFDRLRHIADRAEIGDRHEALLAVTIPERPGAYRRFIQDMGRRAITEFNYRYAGPAAARIFVGVRLSEGAEEKRQIVAHLEARGYPVVDMSDNEMAKLHVRYMVGGGALGLPDERIFRFEFPERPGALLQFLSAMPAGWNISLFHYRNHGADHGRVLAGIQVPPADRVRFDAFLAKLGYPFDEETDNPAYRLFLTGGGTGAGDQGAP